MAFVRAAPRERAVAGPAPAGPARPYVRAWALFPTAARALAAGGRLPVPRVLAPAGRASARPTPGLPVPAPGGCAPALPLAGSGPAKRALPPAEPAPALRVPWQAAPVPRGRVPATRAPDLPGRPVSAARTARAG